MANTYKILPVRLLPRQKKLLERYARKMGVSEAEIIRQLVVEGNLLDLLEYNTD